MVDSANEAAAMAAAKARRSGFIRKSFAGRHPLEAATGAVR
jgi:hypothetical protein